MRPVSLLLIAALAAAASACQKKSPPAPTPSPDGVETIRGTERLGWDQRAGDTAELGTFRYAVYLDGSRAEMSEVACGSAAGPNGFACSGRLPAMTPGQHTLELATFVIDGATTFESSRSAPLRVNVTSALAGARAGSLRQGSAGTTGDGIPLLLDVVLDGLDEPSDLAFAPDGRLFVAERDGVVRVVDLNRGLQSISSIHQDSANGVELAEILALALDAEFHRTGHVFAVLLERMPAEGGPARDAFTVVRYREVNGTLGERAVLLHGVPARGDRAAAAIGIGPDAKLYVALDDGGDARSPADAASLNGKLLRLNRDGTTPDERPGGTPAPAGGYRSPRGLDWGPGGVLWIADGAPQVPERIRAVADLPARPRRSEAGISYALAPETDPSDAVFYAGEMFPSFRGNLLVAAEGGGHILRVRLNPRSPTRVVATERLLEGVGPIRALAVGPDGAIYFATPTAIGRVSTSPATASRMSRQ